MKKVAIFYGSTTGTTEDIVNRVAEKLDADVFEVSGGFSQVSDYSNLIFASSTWGLGELQDDWASNLSELGSQDLNGKKVSFIGTGDGASFADTFVDAIGTIYDEVSNSGATFVGHVDTSDYDYSASTGERDGKFLGLAIDEINEGDKTDSRIEAWVDQLQREFE